MTNWGDIASQQMASKHENRVREARFMANADSYLTEKPKRSWATMARTIWQTVASAPRVAPRNTADANMKRETQQLPAV